MLVQKNPPPLHCLSYRKVQGYVKDYIEEINMCFINEGKLSEFIDFNLSVRSFFGGEMAKKKNETERAPHAEKLREVIENLLSFCLPSLLLLHHIPTPQPFAKKTPSGFGGTYLKPIKKCLEFIIMLRGKRTH